VCVERGEAHMSQWEEARAYKITVYTRRDAYGGDERRWAQWRAVTSVALCHPCA
jgi:hypothetical protein